MLTCEQKQYLEAQTGVFLNDEQAILTIRLILAHLDDDEHSRHCHRGQAAWEWKGRNLKAVDIMAREIADVSTADGEHFRDRLFSVLYRAL